jgi:hypothetical protein
VLVFVGTLLPLFTQIFSTSVFFGLRHHNIIWPKLARQDSLCWHSAVWGSNLQVRPQLLDPPTGVKIMGRDGAKQLCTAGNGGVVMRAITQIEQLTRRGKTQSCAAIVVTELPYQVNKAALPCWKRLLDSSMTKSWMGLSI